MAVSYKHCAPFLSATLFHTKRTTAAFTGELRGAVIAVLSSSSGGAGTVERSVRRPLPRTRTSGDLDISWLTYEEHRSPAWYTAGDLTDTHHHFIAICRKGKLVSMTFSDTGARNIVMRAITRAEVAAMRNLTPLSAGEIESAFVGGQIKTLWLGGAHRRSIVKPDAKVLSGLELGSALDPLEDQSYYFSSVRSTSSSQRLVSKAGEAVIGASPRHARIWIGPTRSWDEFAERIELILDEAEAKIAEGSPATPAVPILAQTAGDISEVEQPYDMAVIVPELTLAGVDSDGSGERWLQQFGDVACFDVLPKQGSPDFEADIYWGDEHLGRLIYSFERRSRGDIRLKVDKQEWRDTEHQQDLIRICRNPDYLTIYFDTGHTFSRGHFYKTQFRDARFDDWEWVAMGPEPINVRLEKPLDGRRFAVENIGNPEDDSLFGLVARNWPDLRGRGPGTGWLVCDDGAMESADFIHFDETMDPPHLTLIHVKGSHSDAINRSVSVSDYEIVVGQAVKNLRHIDRGLLTDKLENNQYGVLRDAVWRDGVRQQDRSGVLQALANTGSNLEKTVVILQPRVRRSVYNEIRTRMDSGDDPNAEVRRMQQLDALLLGARSACYGLGAHFKVIAEDDV